MASEESVGVSSPSSTPLLLPREETYTANPLLLLLARAAAPLDIEWNLALIVVSVVILSCTLSEYTTTPIRIWIGVTGKIWKTLLTAASFAWWIIGIYWIVSGGYLLQHYAPRLYCFVVNLCKLVVVFLAMHAIFYLVSLPCMCCCMPCMIILLSYIGGQEGATESDVGVLTKYTYQTSDNAEELYA
ncbi:hypothetical protein IFM89_021841, partial [Coptis chinensis]